MPVKAENLNPDRDMKRSLHELQAIAALLNIAAVIKGFKALGLKLIDQGTYGESIKCHMYRYVR